MSFALSSVPKSFFKYYIFQKCFFPQQKQKKQPVVFPAVIIFCPQGQIGWPSLFVSETKKKDKFRTRCVFWVVSERKTQKSDTKIIDSCVEKFTSEK
jgi:hypothetical protein